MAGQATPKSANPPGAETLLGVEIIATPCFSIIIFAGRSTHFSSHFVVLIQ
jgi:hypothetical protein